MLPSNDPKTDKKSSDLTEGDLRALKAANVLEMLDKINGAIALMSLTRTSPIILQQVNSQPMNSGIDENISNTTPPPIRSTKKRKSVTFNMDANELFEDTNGYSSTGRKKKQKFGL